MMKNPYEILEVSVDCSDTEIKQAYLKKIKQCPPDRDQLKFQQIHQAYSAIKDHKSRLSHALFSLPELDFNDLIDNALQVEAFRELSPDALLALLQASMSDKTIENSLSCRNKS